MNWDNYKPLTVEDVRKIKAEIAAKPTVQIGSRLLANTEYLRDYMERNKTTVEESIQLAMEQNWFICDSEPPEPEDADYTLLQLASLSFETWAYLIEIENKNNVPRKTI